MFANSGRRTIFSMICGPKLKKLSNYAYGCATISTCAKFNFFPFLGRYVIPSFFLGSFIYSYFKYLQHKTFLLEYRKRLKQHGIESKNYIIYYHYFTMPFKKIFSYICYILMYNNYPIITPFINKILCNFFGLDYLSNSHHKTFIDIFTREPKKFPPMSKNFIVSPCEGRVMGCGKITSSDMIMKHIKGSDCHLLDLVGFEDGLLHKKHAINELYYLTIYLSPSDIHRFYSPCNFKQRSTVQINGSTASLIPLLSKGDFSLAMCTNHRIIVEGESDFGRFLMMPVGANNVSMILMSKEKKEYVNNFEFSQKIYNECDIHFNKGEEMGCFLLGSTIVMIFEAPPDFMFSIKPTDKLSIYQQI